jgi:hypothetical protein
VFEEVPLPADPELPEQLRGVVPSVGDRGHPVLAEIAKDEMYDDCDRL